MKKNISVTCILLARSFPVRLPAFQTWYQIQIDAYDTVSDPRSFKKMFAGRSMQEIINEISGLSCHWTNMIIFILCSCLQSWMDRYQGILINYSRASQKTGREWWSSEMKGYWRCLLQFIAHLCEDLFKTSFLICLHCGAILCINVKPYFVYAFRFYPDHERRN